MDLSALQARLRAEHVAREREVVRERTVREQAEHTTALARVPEPAPATTRLRIGPADVEATQVVSRGTAPPARRGRRPIGNRPSGRTPGRPDALRGAGPSSSGRTHEADTGTAGADPGRRRGLATADGVEPAAEHEDGAAGGSTRSKALWTLADQAVSSATNAAISFLIAHQVDRIEYGAFGIAYTLFALIIGISRDATCMPLSMFYTAGSRASLRSASSAMTGASLTFGIGVGAVLAVIGLGVGGAVGSSLAAMGLVLPGLLLQDAWRYVFFATGRASAAFVNDIAWAFVQLLGIWLLMHRGVTDASPLLLAWGASALVAALLGVVQAGFWPSPGAAGSWFAENRTDATYLAGEFLTVQGALQTSMLLIGAFGSLATIGALQGARTLLGPITVVGVGVVSFALPEFSRRTSMDVRARERAAYALTAVVLGVGSVWSLIFLFLPDRYGQSLLGDSWPGVKSILGLSILHYLAAAVPVGPSCMVYALGKTKITFRLNLAFAPILLGLPVVGALVGEARGAVVGFNLAFWGLAPVWFVLLRRLGREHDVEQAALRAANARRHGEGSARTKVRKSDVPEDPTFRKSCVGVARGRRPNHRAAGRVWMMGTARGPAGPVSGREGPGVATPGPERQHCVSCSYDRLLSAIG
ncbi:hypothetical protein [Candidatus Frankia nodulisporulans]|uniref:hypothetical protein n=1 Tax=Candidatus Frankia nodulisporulans TaxID=2060052 RepID=UPI0015839151|nr:hypothetical protein [Candidatus Frankia nodulisporulans]